MSDTDEHRRLDSLLCEIDDGYPKQETQQSMSAWNELLAEAIPLASKLNRSAELFDALGDKPGCR